MARQHILLIDSDERSLRVMEVSLRQAGLSVSTARDGESAWAKIESERPALLISEIGGLGSLAGFALAERLPWRDMRAVAYVLECSVAVVRERPGKPPASAWGGVESKMSLDLGHVEARGEDKR